MSRPTLRPSPQSPATPRPRGRTRAATGLAIALFAGALLALHGRVLRFPFIADDFIFLHESHTGSLESLLAGFSIVQNYYRPLGREIYFFGLSRIFGTDPLLFHLFNFALLVLTVGLVVALGRRVAGPCAGVLAGGVYALLYPHRVQMAWVSCSQDLLATALGLGATLLYLRGRRAWAAIVFGLALFAKESVAPLALVLALWEAWRPEALGSPWRRARAGLRRTGPLWLAALAWVAIVLGVRAWKQAWTPLEGALPVADVALGLGSLWEGFRLALLSYVYLDQPLGYLRDAMARMEWPWLAALLAAAGAAIAFRMPRAPDGAQSLQPPPPGRARAARAIPPPQREPDGRGWRLGLLWATVGALPVALVGHHFSAYYVSFSGVGFALVVGWLLARAPWPAAVAVLALATAANAAANRVESFRIVKEQAELPGVSFVSISRLEWEVKYIDGLYAALRQDPPPRGGIIYLSHAPPYLTLATAEDRAPRVWFRDPTLDLSYIRQYRPQPGQRPRRFVRFDAERWAFALLPNNLVDAIVEGEETLARRQPQAARGALRRALGLARPGIHDIERVELQNSFGLACYQAGDTAAARGAWLEALSIDAANRGALLNLAALSAGCADFAEARRLTLRVLAKAPADPLALYYLARLERSLGDAAAAQRAWQSLIVTDPAFADSVARRDGAP